MPDNNTPKNTQNPPQGEGINTTDSWFDVQTDDGSQAENLKAKNWETRDGFTDDSSVAGNLHYGDTTEKTPLGSVSGVTATSGAVNEFGVGEGDSLFEIGEFEGTFGSLSIEENGEFTYLLDTEQSAARQLGEGQSVVETFNVQSANGSIYQLVIRIDGTDEIPSLSVVSIAADNVDGVKSLTFPISEDDGNVTVAAENGTIVTNDDGTVTFTPQEGNDGDDTITIIKEDDGTSVVEKVKVTTNQLPTLEVVSTATVDEDGSKTISFTASDLDGTVTTTAESANGTVTVNDDGTIIYQPDADFNGADTITVTTTDDDGASVVKTVAITVNDVNDAPSLDVVSTATLDEDGSKTISFTASDLDGTVTTTAESANGTVTVNDDGTITYQPDADFNGADTITVTTTDDDGASVVKTVAITVNDVNDAPSLDVVSTATLDEDGSKTISFTASDLDGTVTTTAESANGTVTVNDDGTITYQPDADFNGADTITVTTTDDDGASVVKTVTVTVNDINDAPSLDVVSTASVDEDGSKTISFTASDIDGTVTTTAESANGTVTVNDDGTITYQPDADFNGADTITVTTTDDDGASVVKTVAVTVNDINDAPILDVVSIASVDEDGSKTISFTASDLDGTVTTTAESANGTVTVNDDGTITYQPDADFNGADAITITTTDDDGASVVKTVAVTVNDINDAPSLDVVSIASVDEDGSKTISFTASDLDGTVTTTAESANGTVTVNDDGTITYQPDADFNGVDTITVTTTDDDGASVVKTVAVTVSDVNDAPTLEVVSTASVDEDGSKTISFTASDIDGTVTTTAESANGTVTVNDDGTITYQPDADFNGADTITVTTTDDDGASVVKTVAVTVNDVNDAPTLEVVSTASVDEDGSKTISFTASDLDGTVTTTAESANGTVTVNDDGTITYQPDADFNGADTITVTTTDDDGASVVKTVSITVNDVNDAPSLDVVSTLAIEENGSKSFSFSASDIDGTVITSAEADNGTVIVNNDGTITYQPNGDYSGSDTITVTATDDDGASVVKSVDVTVTESIVLEETPLLSVSLGEATTVTSTGQSVEISADSPNIYSFGDAGSVVDSSGNLNLSNGNSTTSNSYNAGNGLGVASAGEKGNEANKIDENEAIAIDLEQSTQSVELTLKHLKGETTTWTVYDESGQQVDSGTIEGPNKDSSFTVEIQPSGDFRYIVLQGNEGSKANGFNVQSIGFTPVDNTEYPLNITTGLIDAPSSANASLTVTNLPDGGVLSSGTQNDDGSWTLTPDELADLTLSVPASNHNDFELTVSSSHQDDEGSTVTSSVTIGKADSGTGTDSIYVGDSNVAIAAGDGDDRIQAGGGTDEIDGGAGNDTVFFTGNANDYSITKSGDSLVVNDTVDGRDGTTTLANTESMEFADETISVEDFVADPLTANFRFNTDDGSYTYNTGGEVKDEAQFQGDAHIEDGVLTLDGDGDYLKVTSSTDINLADVRQRTASFWIKSDQSEGRMMVYEEGGNKAGLNVYIEDGNLYIGAFASNDGNIEGSFIVAEDPNGQQILVTDDEWHHVAVTLDGDDVVSDNGLTAYLDGENVGVAQGHALGVHPDPTGIGGVNGMSLLHTGEVVQGGMHFNGKIDDAKIFSSALDEEGVKEMYQNPPEGVVADNIEGELVEDITIDVPSVEFGSDIDIETPITDESEEDSLTASDDLDVQSDLSAEEAESTDDVSLGGSLDAELPSNGFSENHSMEQENSYEDNDSLSGAATDNQTADLSGDSIGTGEDVADDPYDFMTESPDIIAEEDIGFTPSIVVDDQEMSDDDSSSGDTEKFLVTGNGEKGSKDSSGGVDKFVVTNNDSELDDMSSMDGLDTTSANPQEEQEEIGLAGEEAPPLDSVDQPVVIPEDVA
ncbi:tandem-95 repeat protein [Desulfosediminicola flagellatus]|uniref:tandem-95 repeat protein n=1 Tax=Desulfosediminicola flagellatus TaxID=2569541 RepID=UPI0015942C2C|nr:tandem-95 repeat protein [Desulfosediminicola flagellatus]